MPVLLGIPWLAGVLGSVFTGLVTFFSAHLSKRIAMTAAAVSAISLLTIGFYATLEGLVSAISYAAPSYVSQGASLVLPSNTQACLSAILTAYVARWVYDWNVKIIQWKLF